jgi:enamine deaminase RidA (YjgF/YER057c/UK114 family)
MTIDVKAKLASLGKILPEVVIPAAAYVPAVRTGNIVFTAGQLPRLNGEMVSVGKVGADVTPERAKELAEICVLNCLAAVGTVVELSKVKRVVRVVGYVNGVSGFTDQPSVVNGASELLLAIWGDNGKHARSAVGVAELPFNSPVEIELTVEVE